MAKKNLREFDYKKTAKLDTDMWEAYYNHNFLRLFMLLLKLMRSQFQFNWPTALKSAYYAAIAATNYRLRYGKETFPVAQKYLVKFYKLVSDNATEPFNYQKAAETELEWWNIHRYPTKYEKKLGVSLAEGMAVIYNGKSADFMKYGDYRAEAMILRDNTKAKPDWQKIGALLDTSWQALYDAAQKHRIAA